MEAQQKINLLGVLCSETDGTTLNQLERALTWASANGANTELLTLKGKLGETRNATLGKEIQPGFAEMTQMVLRAHAMIIAMSVNWFLPCPVAVSFVNHIFTPLEEDNYRCKYKAAGFIAVCDSDGGAKACGDLVVPLNHMGFDIPPHCTFYYNTSIPHVGKHAWMDKVETVPEELILYERRMLRL